MLRVGGGGFMEFDVEFKFAKIQSFYFLWGPPPPKMEISVQDWT